MERFPVEISAPTLPGIETLVGTNLINHTYEDGLTLQQGDTDSVWCILMDEVGGTIKGIHHPEHLLCIVTCQAFFCDKASLRKKTA